MPTNAAASSAQVSASLMQADLAASLNLGAERTHRRAAWGGSSASRVRRSRTGRRRRRGGEGRAFACAACSHWNPWRNLTCGFCGCEFSCPVERRDVGGWVPALASAVEPSSDNNPGYLDAAGNGTLDSSVEWEEVEQQALQRGLMTADVPECPICHDNLSLNELDAGANGRHDRELRGGELLVRMGGPSLPTRSIGSQRERAQVVILSCSHIFHLGCIEPYERHVGHTNRSCPVCRTARYSRKPTDAGSRIHRAVCATRIAAAARGWMARRGRARWSLLALLRRPHRRSSDGNRCCRRDDSVGIGGRPDAGQVEGSGGCRWRGLRAEGVRAVTGRIERRLGRDGDDVDSLLAALDETIGLSRSANRELDERLGNVD